MNISLVERLESFSDSLFTVSGALTGLVIGSGAILLIIAVVVFIQSYYRLKLMAEACDADKRPLIFSALVETLGKIISAIGVLAPLLAALVILFGLAKGLSALNEFFAREQLIKELSIAINFLNQSDKVLDVRVQEVKDGISTLRIDYKASDSKDSSIPPVEWTKTLSIRGTELHFDCMVFNFSYSEVGSGRQRNIAIPYRIFSNVVAAREGINLYEDAALIPQEDDYGFIPSVYREKLVKLLNEPQFASSVGIRSVNGSDVWHRDARAGDRLRIKVEQTGGITLELISRGNAQ
ncbi:MAG: hypothetical protein LBB43_04925 [Spirochaetaceae bacterium]|jgi:hypothetical protein|nr:hypothetical protein [Spirochaetaceae bacterium]